MQLVGEKKGTYAEKGTVNRKVKSSDKKKILCWSKDIKKNMKFKFTTKSNQNKGYYQFIRTNPAPTSDLTPCFHFVHELRIHQLFALQVEKIN